MEKIKGFTWILISYIVAFLVGLVTYYQIDNLFAALFVADVVATVIVWLFGLIFNNASFYDPYWSVAPLFLIILQMADRGLWSFTNILLLSAIFLWSLRLTVNWAMTFKSIKIQDWRYDMYKKNNPKLWHIINFFGINLMPTVLVFAALIPAIVLMEKNLSFNILSLIGILIILIGTYLEYIADREMHRHLKSNDKMQLLQKGIWKYSRHPNYLGEISVWFGVYIYMLTYLFKYWYLGIGFLLIMFLFMFISIPMMEKRQIQRRPEYLDYIKQTNRLLPIKR